MPTQTINCPVCTQPMAKENVPQGFEIDYCDEHGVWLDAGEFEAMAKKQGSTGGTGNEVMSQIGKSMLSRGSRGRGLVGALVGMLFSGRFNLRL